MHPRTARSRAQLNKAVLELAGIRCVDDIPVNDIVAVAGVNRSTFYQHSGSPTELPAP
ncbi:TetR/AcrR family transcriptional regulator [Arthrobacter sp. GMC3]|uniref:TetR/AcrR family transcriptional regulator n=1 Tax=Arthrobacter sp. GMC3 TaxID=2058894 RepID=UPI0011B098AB|nr:TetR/AcrR family transcriptional regulator [Arthrobacter sp. GMC3]